MPEQLALDEPLRDRAEVHRDERRVEARAELVDHPREPLLAGAGLAADEDGGRGGRGEPDPLDHLAHRGALGDVARVALDLPDLLLEERVLLPEQPVQPLHLLDHEAVVEGDRDEVRDLPRDLEAAGEEPLARRVGDVERPEHLVLEDERERDERAVAVRGEERLLPEARLARRERVEDARRALRERLPRGGAREREGGADVGRRLARIGDEHHLGARGVDAARSG